MLQPTGYQGPYSELLGKAFTDRNRRKEMKQVVEIKDRNRFFVLKDTKSLFL